MPDLFGWYTPPAASSLDEPSQSAAWAWAQWAAQRDPGTYGAAGGQAGLTAENLREWKPALQRAGVWRPEWDDYYAAGTLENDGSEMGGSIWTAPTDRALDLSSLAGYKIGANRGPGHTRFATLYKPDGSIADQENYQRESTGLKDYAQAAAFIGGSALGLNAAFGGLGGVGTLGTLPAVPGQVAGLPTIGTVGATTLPEVAGLGAAAGGAAAPLSAAGGYGGRTGGGLLTGGVPGAALPAAAASAAPAATAAFDPISAYLTTGASEGSTMLNGITGAGGAAGAVGTGSTAATWDTILNGLSKGSVVRSIFDIGSGLYGMSLARDAAKASDPFAQYRGFYGQQLQALEANPSSITSRPGWRAGLEGVDRQMAARGYYGSGNMDAARTRYAGDFYQQESARLAQLAGAGQTPGAGQLPAAQLTGQGLASIGYGLAPWICGRQP